MSKPKKYTGLVARLPKMPLGEDPDRQTVVEAVKAEILAPESDVDPQVIGYTPLDQAVSNIGRQVQDLVKLQKRTTAGRPWAAEFARAYAELRGVRDKLAEWDRTIGVLLEAYQQLMVDQFEVEGISGLKLESGQPVSTWLEPYAQVVDKEAFRLWCVKQGLERQMSLPWMTTNKLTKDMLLAGEAEPDGVTCFAKTKIRLGSE